MPSTMPSDRQREREREHVRIRWRKEEERERERKRNREEREREREEEEERVRKWGGETSSKAIDLDEGQDDESPYEVGDASEEEVVDGEEVCRGRPPHGGVPVDVMCGPKMP